MSNQCLKVSESYPGIKTKAKLQCAIKFCACQNGLELIQ